MCLCVYVLMNSPSEHRVENPSNYIGTQIRQMKQGSKKWIWGERRRALPESVGGDFLFPKSELIFCTLFGSFSIYIKNLFATNMDSLCLECVRVVFEEGEERNYQSDYEGKILLNFVII